MWKLAILTVFAAISSVSLQNVTLECRFGYTGFSEYACFLNGIEVLDPTQNYVITGQHLEGFSDTDVEVVQIYNSNTPFMIQQIFSTFTNMLELQVGNSGLESISVPNSVQLVWLDLWANNITRLEGGMLQGQSSLRFFYGSNNNIQEIDENAFEGLSSLEALVLINNRVRELAPRTFEHLTNVTRIDFERNNLTSIGEEIFSWNSNLRSLFLEFNEINEIHPHFTANLRESLVNINLTGNICASQYFSLGTEAGWMIMHNALQTCFNNFNGTTPEIRTVTMEFVGNLSLFDEFGNLIIRV